MLTDIAYYQIGGRPLVVYIGLLAIVLFLITLVIGRFRPVLFGRRLGTPVHKTFAGISVGIALIHVILAISAYF